MLYKPINKMYKELRQFIWCVNKSCHAVVNVFSEATNITMYVQMSVFYLCMSDVKSAFHFISDSFFL